MCSGNFKIFANENRLAYESAKRSLAAMADWLGNDFACMQVNSAEAVFDERSEEFAGSTGISDDCFLDFREVRWPSLARQIALRGIQEILKFKVEHNLYLFHLDMVKYSNQKYEKNNKTKQQNF